MLELDDHDDLDRMWRAGLAKSTTAAAVDPAEPIARIEGRLARRHRTRVTRRALVGALALAVAFGAYARIGTTHEVHVAAGAPTATVTVVDGADGTLSITFPGRSRPVALPAGRIRFVVFMTGSHHLVIAGVPGFSVEPPKRPTGQRVRIVVTVRLRPGRYVMHCTLPGHTEAGEEAVLIVR